MCTSFLSLLLLGLRRRSKWMMLTKISSLRLLRPELNCRISLDIQTHLLTTRWPLRQSRETQTVCLALESLTGTTSPFATPVKSSSDQLAFEGKKQEERAKKGKVYVCWEWKAVRVGGVSFLWGGDLVVDKSNGGRKGRKGLLGRILGRLEWDVERELKPLLF